MDLSSIFPFIEMGHLKISFRSKTFLARKLRTNFSNIAKQGSRGELWPIEDVLRVRSAKHLTKANEIRPKTPEVEFSLENKCLMITSLFQIRYLAQIFASNRFRFNRIAFGISIRISNCLRFIIRVSRTFARSCLPSSRP